MHIAETFLARGLRNSTLDRAGRPRCPAFLARIAHAAGPEKDGRILVVLQLDGGNDGINSRSSCIKGRRVREVPAKRSACSRSG